jgi:hypothetical protein
MYFFLRSHSEAMPPAPKRAYRLGSQWSVAVEGRLV